MPMGNPLSPTIADIILDALLEETTEELRKSNIRIKLITKYVDDLFAIIKRKDEDQILKVFNSYHTKLKFTMEKEEDNSIPYLDMRIYREEKRIVTDWYTKPIASGRLINFHSTQPRNQKINTALNLIKKVVKLSDKKFIPKNISKIKEILKNNSYPKNTINDLINKVINNESGDINNTHNQNTSGNPRFYSLQYIPKLTENKQLREIIKDKDVILAHKPNKTINTLFTQTKSKIDKTQQSNVVYEIKCKGNENETCDKIYIGTTKRNLGTRIDEHATDIRKLKQATGLSIHCIEMQHNPDLKNVKILNKERNQNKRYTIESLRIQEKTESAINIKEDKNNINANYTIALI